MTNRFALVMVAAQRTRPRTRLDLPRRAAWKIPTILQCSAAQRERRWFHFFALGLG